MDHGDHSMPGHDMPMVMKCSMNMLWNWQVKGTCVVYESWYISGPATMVLSCLAVVAIAFSYEALRYRIAVYDRQVAASLLHTRQRPDGSTSGRSSPAIESFPIGGVIGLPQSVRTIRAASYGLSVFTSFWLMLVFMTYNGYLIAATVAGAALGHYVHNQDMDPIATLGNTPGKGIACH